VLSSVLPAWASRATSSASKMNLPGVDTVRIDSIDLDRSGYARFFGTPRQVLAHLAGAELLAAKPARPENLRRSGRRAEPVVHLAYRRTKEIRRKRPAAVWAREFESWHRFYLECRCNVGVLLPPDQPEILKLPRTPKSCRVEVATTIPTPSRSAHGAPRIRTGEPWKCWL
jgi:hypothetical protein